MKALIGLGVFFVLVAFTSSAAAQLIDSLFNLSGLEWWLSAGQAFFLAVIIFAAMWGLMEFIAPIAEKRKRRKEEAREYVRRCRSFDTTLKKLPRRCSGWYKDHKEEL